MQEHQDDKDVPLRPRLKKGVWIWTLVARGVVMGVVSGVDALRCGFSGSHLIYHIIGVFRAERSSTSGFRDCCSAIERQAGLQPRAHVQHPQNKSARQCWASVHLQSAGLT